MNNALLTKFINKHKRTDIPEFRPGDTIRVHVRIREGDKERTQAFEDFARPPNPDQRWQLFHLHGGSKLAGASRAERKIKQESQKKNGRAGSKNNSDRALT